MTVTIDITPELESQLRDEAAKQGLDAKGYIVHTLEEHLRQTRNVRHLAKGEADLLRKINQGLPQETWQRYNQLIQKRRMEILSPEEQATLIKISDQIEQANAQRVEYLVQLARLRQMPLEQLMRTLGI